VWHTILCSTPTLLGNMPTYTNRKSMWPINWHWLVNFSAKEWVMLQVIHNGGWQTTAHSYIRTQYLKLIGPDFWYLTQFLCHVTLKLAETLLVRSRPSVPYIADLLSVLTTLNWCPAILVCSYTLGCICRRVKSLWMRPPISGHSPVSYTCNTPQRKCALKPWLMLD